MGACDSFIQENLLYIGLDNLHINLYAFCTYAFCEAKEVTSCDTELAFVCFVCSPYRVCPSLIHTLQNGRCLEMN
jgi:hypothetical protein